MAVVVVTTVVDSEDVAGQLSRAGVESRLAACGQVGGPIVSTFSWLGRLDTAREWTVAFKTTEDAAPELVELVRRLHPYEVPEILLTPVIGGHPAYLDWVAAETQSPSRPDSSS